MGTRFEMGQGLCNYQIGRWKGRQRRICKSSRYHATTFLSSVVEFLWLICRFCSNRSASIRLVVAKQLAKVEEAFQSLHAFFIGLIYIFQLLC